jgi:hypothetical protein
MARSSRSSIVCSRPAGRRRQPADLVRIYHRRLEPSPRSPAFIHYPGFQGIVTHAPPDLETTAYTSSRLQIGRGESAPLARVAWVGPRYFSVLRTGAPALGRYPTDAEAAVEQPSPLVVISHAQWTGPYGADPGVVGQTVEFARKQFTIIGVAPRGFAGIEWPCAARPPAQTPRAKCLSSVWTCGRDVAIVG